MMLHATNNSHPSFGMALRAPKTTTGQQRLAQYIGIGERPFVKRGLEKFAKSHAKNPYDIVYNETFHRFDVYNGKSILKSFNIDTSAKKPAPPKSLGQSLKTLFKGLYKAAVEPEAFLPKELKQAGKFSNEHLQSIHAASDKFEAEIAKETAARLKKEKAGQTLTNILNKFCKE
ncbi:MAG: hypothetical protein E7Z92_02055 [Cyanobacteria bacterium SIG31]|nr:hypothetical protein [Cyanobacteria bacterium SIG31]